MGLFVLFFIFRSSETTLIGGMATTNWMNLLKAAVAKKLPISLQLCFNDENMDRFRVFWNDISDYIPYINVVTVNKDIV